MSTLKIVFPEINAGPQPIIFIAAVLKLIFLIEYFQSGRLVNGMKAINNRWL